MLMFLSASNIYTTHFNVMTYRSALHTLAYYIVSYQEDGGKQQRDYSCPYTINYSNTN